VGLIVFQPMPSILISIFLSFCDRDMFMRYQGGAVGHAGLRLPTDSSFEMLANIIPSTADPPATGCDDVDDADGGGEGNLGAEEERDYAYWTKWTIDSTEGGLEKGGTNESEESEGEEDMNEDGEDTLDFGQPENDGYGTFN
jgi:hypothetical protein